MRRVFNDFKLGHGRFQKRDRHHLLKSLARYSDEEKEPEAAFVYSIRVYISNEPKCEMQIIHEMSGHFIGREKGYKT